MDTQPDLSHRAAVLPAHLENQGYSRKMFLLFLSFSVLGHVLFFLGILFFHNFEMSRPLPKIVRVDLVSFAPGTAGSEAAEAPETGDLVEPVGKIDQESTTPVEPDIKSDSRVEAETIAIPDPQAASKEKPDPQQPLQVSSQAVNELPVHIEPDISLKTKPKNLKDLLAESEKEKEKEKEKKKPIRKKPKKALKAKADTEKILKKARQRLAADLEARKKQQIADALSRMKDSVKTGKVSGTGGIHSPGKGTGPGQKGYDPIDLYKMLLQSAIEQNWVFNQTMAGMDQNLEVRILLKILKSGEIRDITYETRSGNRYLDESAKKAIKRASPLPELPRGMGSYDVVVIFTPKGLK